MAVALAREATAGRMITRRMPPLLSAPRVMRGAGVGVGDREGISGAPSVAMAQIGSLHPKRVMARERLGWKEIQRREEREGNLSLLGRGDQTSSSPHPTHFHPKTTSPLAERRRRRREEVESVR
jgi:hypothetical protein